MSTGWIIALCSVPFLLCLSAFLSAAETAVTGASRARIHQQAKKGNVRAKWAAFLIEERARVIAVILLANNLVNILASALTAGLFIKLFGEAGIAYATLVMTALIVIFAELLPKTWTIAHPSQTALTTARALRMTLWLLGPIADAAQIVTRFLLHPFRNRDRGLSRAEAAREELRGAIDLHHREGAVVKGDRDMIGAVLELDETHVREVMVHRDRMAAADASLPSDKLVKTILACGHSRVPLWSGNPENIVGLLHVKDLLRAIVHAGGRVEALDIPALARETLFVSSRTSLRTQMNDFLKRKRHCAIVLDDDEKLLGLVTLEDILEEIVGEIDDEHDHDLAGLERDEDGSIILDGAVKIRDLNRILNWRLPDDAASTIAGLVASEARKIPRPGEVFVFHGARFEILERRRQKITRLKASPVKA